MRQSLGERRGTIASGSRTLPKAPALPLFAPKILVCLVRIGEAHIGRIPQQPLGRHFFAHSETESDIPQQDGFCERTSPIKIRTTGLTPFARINPLFVMSRRARQRLWQILKLRPPRLRNDPAAKPFSYNFAIFSDEHHSRRGQRSAIFQVFWPWRSQSAVVPCQLHWRHFTARRKMIGYDR